MIDTLLTVPLLTRGGKLLQNIIHLTKNLCFQLLSWCYIQTFPLYQNKFEILVSKHELET